MRRLMGAGIITVSDCTPERVSARLAELRARGLKGRSIGNEIAALCAVLAVLVDFRLFDGATLSAIRRQRPKIRAGAYGAARWITREEVERLARSAAVIAPRLELPIRVAALSGARPGELARMHRDDFDGLEGPAPFLRVTELEEFGDRGTAKTGGRRVPVCSELRELVLERCGSGWLFANEDRQAGRRPRAPFISSWTLEHELQFARRGAGLPDDIVFTTLRHTRASWWLQAGVSIYKVATWLGHSVRVCERHYAGLEPYDKDCERMPA